MSNALKAMDIGNQKASEQEIQNAILHFLNSQKIFCFKVNNTGVFDGEKYRKLTGFSMKGISDIIGVLKDGRILCIEVKSQKGKTSPEQEAFIKKINKSGGVALVARSVKDVEHLCLIG